MESTAIIHELARISPCVRLSFNELIQAYLSILVQVHAS